jgi:hypothetical protein
MKNWKTLIVAALVAALAGPAAALATNSSSSDGGRTLFIRSAVEHAGDTVTFPLHRGTSQGKTVWYIVLDSSNGNDASAKGVNTSQKLANARGTTAVQRVSIVNGVLDFPASVDFSPEHIVQAPNGFPPTTFQAGAVGQVVNGVGYSPLIQLPDGTVENAPQIAFDANGDGTIDLATEAADKVVSLDIANGRVTYRETNGFARTNPVKYVSTDSSDPLAAALEDATLAPALDAAPFAGGEGTDSARASLAAFVNGQTGAANPQRQGLNSAVADGLDPLNILAWRPTQGRYSPLWDVHLAQWSASAVAAGANTRQTEFEAVEQLAENGTITAPGGTPFGASGFIVDCPIVSQG